MEFSQTSLRTCSICSSTIFNEEASGGVGLSVPLPDTAVPSIFSGISLKLSMQTILNQYFTSEDATAYCEVCLKDTLHKRKLGLLETPEFLVIQAKIFYRENGVSKKKKILIEAENISLITESPGQDSVQYRIYAVVAHVGDSIEGGHFTTIACGSGCSARIPCCGSESGCWWHFDDNDVTGPMPKDVALELLNKINVSLISVFFGYAVGQLKVHIMMNSQAVPYILFYVRCGTEPAGFIPSAPNCGLCELWGKQWRSSLPQTAVVDTFSDQSVRQTYRKTKHHGPKLHKT